MLRSVLAVRGEGGEQYPLLHLGPLIPVLLQTLAVT